MALNSEGLAVLAAVSLVVLILLARWLSAIIGFFESVRVEHVTLSCPQCGEETSARRKTCERCGGELQ